ncbi:uncharacterized protein LOC128627966 [Artibeus jamaicensis]|uniref:uncharacterized protein LOC128627966 n=1 Tax=Artibeus jamaicensis TaxID=9417 RepID=UPI00235AAA92|nr:uncharacterized protein LOC128627966 [Artibeus jamaicensis]
METGRLLSEPATPPSGGHTKHVILSSWLGDSPGAARAATPRPRAWQPSRVHGPRTGLSGCPGRLGQGSQQWLPGCAARGFLAPSCPIRTGPGARRAAWGRRSASQGRGESATDTCLQESARRARSAPIGSASCRPGRRRPRRRPSGSSSRSSFSRRSPARGSTRSGPQFPPSRPRSAPAKAQCSLWHRQRMARPRRSEGSLLLPRAYSPQQLPPRDTLTRTHTDSHTHSCNSGDLGIPHREVTLLGQSQPFPFLPQRGTWSSCGGLLLPKNGVTPWPPYGEGLPQTGRTLGWGLRTGVSGQVSKIPTGRAKRSG